MKALITTLGLSVGVGLLLLTPLPGCGSGSGVSLGQFPKKYAEALCAQNFACALEADIGGLTMQDCIETNVSALGFLQATIDTSRSKGRVAYDPDQMQACVDAIAQLSCDQWRMGFSTASQPAACGAAVAPKVAPGGACLDDIECTTHTCEGEDYPSDTDGTCAAASSLGKPCAGSADCSLGFYCDTSAGTCAAERPAGADCDLELECATSCNGTTHLCSTYAGCAVADGDPRHGLASLLLVVAVLALRRRRRRGGYSKL